MTFLLFLFMLLLTLVIQIGLSIEVRTDDVIVIIGKRRSGKSIFFKHLLKPVSRRIIWDYNHEHGDMGYIIHYASQIPEEWKRGIVHIVYQPYTKTLEEFESFLRICWLLNNYVLGIEEVERYATTHFMPTPLKKLIDVGRHKGIGIYATCRRVMRVNPDLPFNADHIFCFRQHRPQDIGYLKEWIGEKAEELRNIPDYYFLHYDDRKGETFLRQKVQF